MPVTTSPTVKGIVIRATVKGILIRLETAITPVATSRRLTVAPTIWITLMPTSSMRMLLNSYALDSYNRKLGLRRGTTAR